MSENKLSEKGEDELTNLAISFNHFVNKNFKYILFFLVSLKLIFYI